MVVIRRYIFIVLLLVLVVKEIVLAKTKISLLNNFLFQSGNGGRQVNDDSGSEDLSLFQPMLFIESQINELTNLNIDGVFDTWTAASEKAFDTGTGASGRIVGETRSGVDIGISHRKKTWIFSPSAGFSDEMDYKSIHGKMNINKSFAEDNFNIGVGYRYYEDSARLYDIIGKTWLDWLPRRTHSVDAAVSQILSRKDIVLIGCGITRQSGYLEGNRNTVKVAGTRILEVLPDKRNKFVSTLRHVHGLNDVLALHTDYRYYRDDWDIRAHTLEPSLAFALQEDAGLLQLIYRYSQQSKAKYYGDEFAVPEQYMTSDSDLASFHSDEAGIRYSYEWDTKSVFDNMEAGGSVFYYVRSNDLSAVIFQLSIGGSF